MWFTDLGYNIRIVLRNARRRPAYALTCVLVLAVGIGTCTAVFSALYSAVLKPLPYPDAGQLVSIHNRFPSLNLPSMGGSAADYGFLSESRALFSNVGAYYFLDLSRGGIEIPEKVNAVAVTASLLRTLGVQPVIGRSFNDTEERENGPPAVLISDVYWHGAFAADPEILNRSLVLNGDRYPIVGVMPKSFAFPNDVTQMWVPVILRNPADAKSYYLRMYARIAPGLSMEQGAAGLDQLSRQLSETMPQLHAIAPQGWSYFLTPMLRNDDASVQRWLWILFAAVGCFLLIVCSNVAGLVLLRSTERRFEFAVRLALGAGRWRITQEVLAEVLVFSALGGTAGLSIARVGIELLARYAPGTPPQFELSVFWFCAGLSLLAGMIAGLLPALHATSSGSASVVSGLTSEGFQKTAGMGKRRWQQALTVSQIAIATALLLCGGLLVRSLLHLLQSPLGFEPRGVLTMNVSLPPQRYKSPESRTQFYDQLFDLIAALPGVEAASGCSLLPFGYGENVNTFEIVGESKQPDSRMANLNQVTDGYFATLRIPLVRGRGFQPEDRRGERVTLIDEAFARKFFGGEDPIGRQIKMPWGLFTIAGIVGSVKSSAIDTDPAPTLYFDRSQSPGTDLTLGIRSSLADGQLAREVQKIVTSIDPDQPVYDVVTLQARIDRSLKSRRFVAWSMSGFALAGTLLAAIGLYGLLSYAVTLRRREIGIRMALGASSGNIAGMVCRGGLTLVFAGLIVGGAAAAGTYRFIASQMYGVDLQDPTIWIIVAAAIGIPGVVASAIPALRAARSQPLEVLRRE